MKQRTDNRPSETRIPALDGFRGLAILMVTIYRFGEVSLTSNVIGNLLSKAVFVGASGVDFFFVLSGFLITGILLDSKQSGQSYFGRFYFRRTLRIFPLYFATLFCLLVLFPFALGNRTIIDAIRGDTIHLWLYTVNLNVAWLNDWAFGPMNHFWSLAIEEQFYLVWPLVVYLMDQRKLGKLCIILVTVFAISRVTFSVWGLGENTEKSFTLFRLDGLLMGALAAILVRQAKSLSSYRNWMLFTFSILLALFAMTLLVGKNDYTVRYTLVSGMATILLLMTQCSSKKSLINRALQGGWLRSLGKYSYAMYVFQAPLIPLLKPWINSESITERVGQPIVGGVLYLLIMFSITYMAAMVSWHAFEKWFLRLRNWQTS